MDYLHLSSWQGRWRLGIWADPWLHCLIWLPWGAFLISSVVICKVKFASCNFWKTINLPLTLPGQPGPLPEAWRVLHCSLLVRDLRCSSWDLPVPFLYPPVLWQKPGPLFASLLTSSPAALSAPVVLQCHAWACLPSCCFLVSFTLDSGSATCFHGFMSVASRSSFGWC